MSVLGTVFAFLPGDSTLCFSVVSLERMFQTLGLAFPLLNRQIVPQTAGVHGMIGSLEIRTPIHITSETWIPSPLLFRFLRLFRTCLVWMLACRQRDRTGNNVNDTWFQEQLQWKFGLRKTFVSPPSS